MYICKYLHSEEGSKHRVESSINKYISIQRTFIQHKKSNEKFIASLYQIYRTDTGHDFSLYIAYELLMNFRSICTNIYLIYQLQVWYITSEMKHSVHSLHGFDI